MATQIRSQFARQFDFGDGQKRERPTDQHGRFVWAPMNARASGDATAPVFEGHAALFNDRTLIGNKRYGFYEELAPGAFKKTLQEADVRFLFNHDPNLILGRNKAGTLTLSEDKQGLFSEAPLDLRYGHAQTVAVGLERGDLTQMSFAFDPITWERSENVDDGLTIYRHTEVRLWDVSVVTYPAYTNTDAGLRTGDPDVLAAVAEGLGIELERLMSWDPATMPFDELRSGGTSERSPDSTGLDPQILAQHERTAHLLASEQMR
jgi:uncharacterized protein